MLVYGIEVPDSEIALMRMPRAESQRKARHNKADYYQRNKERLKAQTRRHYRENKDDPEFKARRKEESRRYYEAHREEIKARQRAYYRRKKLEGLRTGNGVEHEHEQ